MEEFPENSSECRRRSLTLMAQNESWRSLISELTNQRLKGTVGDALATPSGDGRGVLWWAAYHGSVEGTVRILLTINLSKFLEIISYIYHLIY